MEAQAWPMRSTTQAGSDNWLYVLIHAEKIGWIVASLCLCKTTIVRAVSSLDTVNLVGWHEVDVGGFCGIWRGRIKKLPCPTDEALICGSLAPAGVHVHDKM